MDNKNYQAIQRYLGDLGDISIHAARTESARRKRGEKVYCSRLKLPNVEECYIINESGQKGLFTIVVRYGNRYYYYDSFYQIDGTRCTNVNILTDHFLERYRCRNNMYASNIGKVLFELLKITSTATQAKTERFERALVLKNNCCVPVEVEKIFIRGQWVLITTYITYLNEQDKKVRNLGIAAQKVDNEVNKMFDEDTIKNTKIYV